MVFSVAIVYWCAMNARKSKVGDGVSIEFILSMHRDPKGLSLHLTNRKALAVGCKCKYLICRELSLFQ